MSKRPGVAGPEGCYPAFAESWTKTRVFDVDRNPFIDWTSGLGALMFGQQGQLYSLPHTSEVRLAERLVTLLPGAEQVKFFSSGTEACMAAIATARAATGRTIIVTSDQSYHGWSDQYRASKPEHPGVPQEMCGWIRTFKYNDLYSLSAVVGDDTAAVMMEPALIEKPNEGFLGHVKDIAQTRGALLVFDEMLLGFRLAIGGGGEYFGVTPDLSTYGKPIGRGHPFAILAGAERYMRHATFASGTFCGQTAACEAAIESLYEYEHGMILPTLWRVGECLVQMIQGAIAVTGAPLSVVGYPVLPVLRWTIPDEELLLQSLLQQELADRGVLIHASGRLLPSAAHDDECLARTAHAFREALGVVAEAVGAGEVKARVRGIPTKASGVRPQPAWELLGVEQP